MKAFTVTVCFTIEAEDSESAFAFGHGIAVSNNMPDGFTEVVSVEDAEVWFDTPKANPTS